MLGDPLLLHQALLNILINAEHAVSAHRASPPIDIISDTDAARERVWVTIRDTGPGIAPEALPRVFDPFFTTKEVGQGTGLGLAITYGIVQEHGGTITASNAAGRRRHLHRRLSGGGSGGKVTKRPSQHHG